MAAEGPPEHRDGQAKRSECLDRVNEWPRQFMRSSAWRPIHTGQESVMNRFETHSKVTPMPRRDRGGARMAKPYVLAWLVLGAGAITYLALLGLAPGLLRSDTATVSAASIDQARQELALLGKNLAVLEDTVAKQEGGTEAIGSQIADLRDEITDLKQQIVGMAGANQELAARLATVEQGSTTSKKTAAKAAPTPAVAVTGNEETGEEPSIVGSVIEEEPVPLTKKAADKTKKAAAKQQTATAAPAKTFAVELAQSTSPEALRLNWELLNEQHAALFGGLKAKAAGDAGNYRLLAGPFANQAAANAACAKLKAQSLPCSVKPFTGDAL